MRPDRRGPIAALGTARLPIGVSLGTIGESAAWWLEGARRLDAAGYAGLWAWDHHGARGTTRPVLEGWTILAAAAAVTRRIALGTHVLNVMNRPPAVVAQAAATLQAVSGGRLVLGIGIGGHPADHEPLGIALPPVAERVARLEEAVEVLRRLWTGERVSFSGRYYPLAEARLAPAPDPAPPILVAGQSSAGARIAARIGDGWTTRPDLLPRLLPAFESSLAEAGRRRDDVEVVVGWEGGRTGVDALAASDPWITAPGETFASWHEAGADVMILTARTTADVDRLVGAAGRW